MSDSSRAPAHRMRHARIDDVDEEFNWIGQAVSERAAR